MAEQHSIMSGKEPPHAPVPELWEKFINKVCNIMAEGTVQARCGKI